MPGEQWNNRPWWKARFPQRARFKHGTHEAHTHTTTWRRTRFAIPSERAAEDEQNFWLLENEKAFPWIYLTLVSPCVAGFICHKLEAEALIVFRFNSEILRITTNYCKSRIFRMHVIFVHFVRGGFHTKIKCTCKVQSKSENPQRSATVRKFHAYERSESPGYEN